MRLRSFPRWLGALGCGLLSVLAVVCASPGRDLARKTSVESRLALESGNAGAALDGYRNALEKDPGNKALAAEYAATVERVKRMADEALGRKELGRAGDLYRLLLDRHDGLGSLSAGLSFDKAGLRAALKSCRLGIADAQVPRALREGDFLKALKIRQDAVGEDPNDVGLKAKYRETVLAVKRAADKALADGDFARAGAACALLLRNYGSLGGLRPPVGFTKDVLARAVSDCREGLTAAGLAEYRKGNLAAAIAVWESLLAFDPDNAEIKKAVSTARIQLDAIKKGT